eukprot:9229617-Pyramimonas_sp.AAC.1
MALTSNVDDIMTSQGCCLQAGDRLEATPLLPDVDAFDHIKVFPCLVTFWRQHADSRCYHRNPLLDSSIGTSLATFSLDELHCLHLGVFKNWGGLVIWRLIKMDAYQ